MARKRHESRTCGPERDPSAPPLTLCFLHIEERGEDKGAVCYQMAMSGVVPEVSVGTQLTRRGVAMLFLKRQEEPTGRADRQPRYGETTVDTKRRHVLKQ